MLRASFYNTLGTLYLEIDRGIVYVLLTCCINYTLFQIKQLYFMPEIKFSLHATQQQGIPFNTKKPISMCRKTKHLFTDVSSQG